MKFNEKEIIKTENEIEEALLSLKKVWIECQIVLSTSYLEDINEYICENYPFEKSFDEINVVEWIDKTVKTIHEKRDQRKKEF